MPFQWSCDPREFESMGKTYQPGIGLKREPGETWPEAAARMIPEDRGPLLARWVNHHPAVWDRSILDFGCGAGAVQVQALRLLGVENIIGYEWPPEKQDKRAEYYWDSVEYGALDPKALAYQYDVVLASNVLNVQPSWGCFHQTLNVIKGAMALDGIFVANLASEPRPLLQRGRAGDREVDSVLREHFDTVEVNRVPKADGKLSATYIWVCQGVHYMHPAKERMLILRFTEEGIIESDNGL